MQVVADDLPAGAGEDFLGRRVAVFDGTVSIERNHAIGRGREQCPQARLAFLQPPEHLAMAQSAVGGRHQSRERSREGGDRNRNEGDVGGRAGWHDADEARGGHAGVVHARDRQPHDHGAGDGAHPRAPARAGAAQTEAHRQRHDGQGHSNDD